MAFLAPEGALAALLTGAAAAVRRAPVEGRSVLAHPAGCLTDASAPVRGSWRRRAPSGDPCARRVVGGVRAYR